METIYKELLAAMDKGCLVVFCGSGTSSALGLPTWKGLVMEVIDQIAADEKAFLPLKDLLTSDILSPLAILDLLEDEHRPLITEVLLNRIDRLDKYLSYTLQRKIFRVSERIITTNFDKAFENALDIPNVILNDGKFKLAKIADQKRFLFKLHGDINNPEDCILFSSQFESLYKSEAFLLGLKVLFIQKTVLFIGFSLDDPYVAEIINNITETFNGFNRKHYIITTDGRFRSDKFRKKVQPHIINAYSELDVFLDTLINYDIARKRQIAVHNIKFEQGTVQLWNNGELEAVNKCVQARRNVTVLWGDAGSGKSSLAREFAFSCLENLQNKSAFTPTFAFGVWFNIEDGSEKSHNLNSLLDEIGRVTGFLKVTYLPSDALLKKIQQVNEILKSYAVLIIIDSYHLNRDLKLEEWIQGIDPPSEVILTSTALPAFSSNAYKVNGLSLESIKRFVIQETETRGLESKRFMTSETVNQLFEITNGNPQALLLVIGIIANGEFDPGYLLKENRGSIGKLNLLYEISWNKLSTSSASLLTYFPLLSAKSCMEGEALRYISNLEVEKFNACISELNKWNLINFDGDNGLFCIHSTLLAFVNEKEYLKENQNSIRVKYILFYLQLAKHNIKREYPNEEYWNSLVSAKMDVLDLQRDAIFTAINWAFEIKGQELSVVNFAKIILHYLDSRFHNQLRIELVKKAIEICSENGDCYFEAVLKIDALGWTLVEEGELQQASDTIQSGRQLLECNVFDDAKKTDLLALSNAWLARVKSEQLATEEATQLIQEALKYNGRPWIEYRIHMAAGDVFYKLNDLKESLKNYQLALTRLREYNGEGSNYQINPRLALAYLRLGDTYLNEAEKIFTKLKQNTRIKIGELYGEFGLAMIEYERGFKDGVKEKVQKLEAEIMKRSPKNLLLKLVTEYKNQKFP